MAVINRKRRKEKTQYFILFFAVGDYRVFDGTADTLKAPIEPLRIRHIEEIWIACTELLGRKNRLGLGKHMRQFLRPGEMTQARDAPADGHLFEWH